MNVALIDADILVYQAAHSCQQVFEWEPGEFSKHASMPDAQKMFIDIVDSIKEATDANRAILCLTDHNRQGNFRRGLYPLYKSTRDNKKSERPMLYSALRQWIRESFEVRQKPGIEADDTLGILATGDINTLPPRDRRIICSIDKDMLTIPGLHYNWRKSEDGIRHVGWPESVYNHMLQTLTGDSSDNYPGCPKIGPKRAELILSPLRRWSVCGPDGSYERKAWELVVDTYESKGLTEDDAIVQARCARILQAEDWDFETDTPIMWTPPTLKESNEQDPA